MSSEQLETAMRSWEAGDLDGAAVLFREVAATGDPEASHLLACLLEDTGDLDGAEAAHRSVIQSGDPVFGQRSAIAMGLMLVAAREWPAAHRVLSIAADGADFEVAALADTALVLVCTELGDASGAAVALERARRCDSPSVAELAERLELPDIAFPAFATPAELYEVAEDEEDYRRLLTCGDPEVVSLSAFRLYQLYADEGDCEASREVCEHAIAVGHPDHLAMAYKLLGGVLVDLGEYAEAVGAYARAAEDPRPELRLPALLEQAKVIAQLGDEDATKAIFHRVIASGQREYAVEAYACLAQMHTEAGEVAEALTALRAVLDAGESEWSSICVTLLGLLLDEHPESYGPVMELVTTAAGHPDSDTAFKAALLLDHDARQQPLADPVAEQACQDADDGLARLRAGELEEARRLLRRAADSGAATQSVRAMVTLAELELGEGDREQAEELLCYVAQGDDLVQGFTATFLLHLLSVSGTDLHPVLRAVVDHQRLGREEGLIRYRAAMDHDDPATAAIGTAVFAQVLASIGYEVSEAAKLFESAAGTGDPFALSYTAAIHKEILVGQDQREQAVELLRRARACGHPALAPWVAYGLAELVGEDPAEARAAYAEVLRAEHAGLRAQAAGGLLRVYEQQGDLLAACRLHERLIAEGDTARSGWLLGLTRVRLDDVEGARAAFGLVPDGHPEQGEMGRCARLLLDRDFAAAGRSLAAIPDDGRQWLATMLAVQSARVWQREGERAAADAALSLVLEAGHLDVRQQAGCHLGALRDDAGDRAGAISVWERAAEGADEGLAAVALRGLGGAWLAQKSYDAAARAYGRALTLAPDDRHSALRLGEALVGAGDLERAREVLRDAFGDAAELHLAGFLRDHGHLTAAIAALTSGPPPEVGAGTASAVARMLGELLAVSGDPAGARDAFGRAVAADPEGAGSTLVRAGRCLEEAGDGAGAREMFELAAVRDGDEWAASVARTWLGTASPQEVPWGLAALGDHEGALKALTESTGSAAQAELILALDADDVPEVRRLLAERPSAEAFAEVLDVAATLEGADPAEELYRLVIELGEPDERGRSGMRGETAGAAAAARVGLGGLLAGRGEHCRAELCLLPATRDAGSAEPAWRGIGVARWERGDLDGAVEALRAAMPAAAVQLAELLRERGDAEEARQALDAGVAAGDLECLRHLMVHLLQHEEYAAIPEEAEQAVGSGDPETVAVGYWTWGEACRSTGDLAGAVLMFRKAIDAGHADVVPSVRGDLAQALRASGDAAAAAEQALLAVESADPDAAARAGVDLGCWLHEDGDPLGAADAFAAAVRARPGSEAARMASNNLAVLARQACERAEHQLAVQILSRMGEEAAGPARRLGELCDDPAAVRLYYELAGSDPYTELELAGRLAELGETAEARARYERLNGHEDPDVRFVAGGRLLDLLDSQGDAAAFHLLAERQAGDSDSPVQGVFGSLLGLLQEREGDTEASLRTLRAAAEGGEPTALTVLAQALVGAGQVAEGREVYERVLEEGDAGLAARAMVALGNTFHDEDPALARGWYVRAVGAAEGHTAALAAMYLGALAKRERDFPEALGWYQRVIDAGDTESAMAAAHLGELCYWLGDRDGALRYYDLTLNLTERPELVAEAACRLGEIRYAHGDLPAARRLLELAVETGDDAFAPEAEDLLAKLG
ncbi:tetratricopeptide repeat protein [Nonomuraea sp. LPB2021202275-12-8]|uniref:tetratricopeptide repeat protein n=1 Tax=Nonomuraea sp. LPB2021202275-12-8 TaxID=3120159 RepID=UPI00300CB1CF